MSIVLFGIAVTLIILEMMTVTTFLIWPGLGFLAAAFASLFTQNIVVLSIVFALVTIASVLLLKTKYAKVILPRKKTETSYNEYLGKHAILLDNYISNGVDSGTVKLNGVEWQVKSRQIDEEFKKGERVIITGIEGVHLIIGKEE